MWTSKKEDPESGSTGPKPGKKHAHETFMRVRTIFSRESPMFAIRGQISRACFLSATITDHASNEYKLSYDYDFNVIAKVIEPSYTNAFEKQDGSRSDA